MRSLRIALYVGVVALLVAIYPWGDQGFEGYYTGLRFLICGICTFGAYVSLRERSTLAAPFLIVGVLFNPFVEAHANRTFWIAVDLIVATGFIAVARMAARLDAAKEWEFPILDAAAPPETQTAEISS